MRKSKPTDGTSAKLFLVKPHQPEPSAALVEELIESLAHTEFAQFAMELSGARTMFRKYKALVEAPGFPELLRKHYIEEWEHAPEDECVESDINVLSCMEADTITPEAREQLLPRARQIAQDWMRQGIAG